MAGQGKPVAPSIDGKDGSDGRKHHVHGWNEERDLRSASSSPTPSRLHLETQKRFRRRLSDEGADRGVQGRAVVTRLDYSLLALAAAATAGILITQHLKPLPLHRRAWVQMKAKVGR